MDIFQRGQSMNFVQKSNFLLSLFFTEIMSEKIFFGFFKQKTIIFRPKNRSFNKGQEMDFFKGVSPWIMSKNQTFSVLPFSHKPYKKRSFLILSKEKNDLKQKKIEVLKRIKKWTFLKEVSPWILSRNGTFSYRRFSQKSYQKTCFLIFGKERIILSGKKLRF